MCAETNRLNFVINRDGMDAAIQFAKQTYKVYRTSLKQSHKHGHPKPHFATLSEYRKGFVQSCLSFRKFILENKGV